MNQIEEKTILIMGTGSMACLFAARLSAAAIPVQMFGSWKEGIKALRQYCGVRLVSDSGVETIYPVQVFDSLSDFSKVRQSIVLVKSWQTSRTADLLAQCLHRDGIALTLQNGIGNWEILKERLGNHRSMLGVTTIGATLLEPGRVKQFGEPVISVSDHPRLKNTLDLLSQAGFYIEQQADPSALLWGKLIINAAINPITALLRIPNGELLKRSSARNLMREAADEAVAVAAAMGIHLPFENSTAAVELVAYQTAENLSSMLQDIMRGAPTEIDAICGEIIKLGEYYRVNTPILRTLWQLIKSLDPENP